MTIEMSPISRYLMVAAAVIIVIAGMKTAQTLLVPFFLSLFIAVICAPPLTWMKRQGIPNLLAVVIVIIAIVVSAVAVGVVVGASFNEFRGDLPKYQERLGEIMAGLQTSLNSYGIDVQPEWQESLDPGQALTFAGNALASLGNVMTDAFLILLTVIFMLAEEVRFSDKYRVVSTSDNPESTLKVAEQFSSSVNRYMAIKAAMSFITGVSIFVWLSVQGVDYAVLWGMLAFLLNFIPTLGSIIAAIPAVLLSLVQLGVPDAVITAIGFLLVNVIVGNGMEPRIMGRGLDLSALVVFLSLVFWGWVLGSVGMLLSVPLTMTVKIALESFEETRWLGVMLGSGRDIRFIAEKRATTLNLNPFHRGFSGEQNASDSSLGLNSGEIKDSES